MHSAGLPPASGLGWFLFGGTPRRGKLAGFILTIDCTLLASSGTWPRLSVGWRRAGNVPLHLNHRLHSPGLRLEPGPGWMSGGTGWRAGIVQASSSPSTALCVVLRPAPDLAGPCGSAGAFPFPSSSPLLPTGPTPFSYYPSNILNLPSPKSPCTPFSRGPIHTPHTLTPGPFRGGDYALLDCGICLAMSRAHCGRPAWTSTRDRASVSAGSQARDPDAGD